MPSSDAPGMSSATRRRPLQTPDNPDPDATGLHYPVTDQSPTPKPLFQYIALGLIIFLGFLQFLPATHFRDPSDPFRKWLPYASNSSISKFRSFGDEKSGFVTSNGKEDGTVHIVSWMECLDLRVLAVLANSTLSASSNLAIEFAFLTVYRIEQATRYPDLLHFHFFLPKGKEDKVSFFKLKVLFPHSNLQIHGQEEVKEVSLNRTSGVTHSAFKFEEIAPFLIPRIHKFLSKFIYILPDVIVKGKVEELVGVDLSNYAIAAAEDCSERLNTYVNSDVLDAIQRSASKPWVSETPYAKNSCMPDLSVLLIDARKLEIDFLEALLWWNKVLNLSERSMGRNPAISLVLYDRHLKLSSSWLVRDSTSPVGNESFVIHYDGPKTVCSEFGDFATMEPGHGKLWRQHLSRMSDRIVGS